jgi:AraC-like DNA-binding protein
MAPNRNPAHNPVRHLVRQPRSELRPYVREILWVSSTEPRQQVLLPETNLTAVFRLSGHASLQDRPLSYAVVSGLQKRSRIAHHSANSAVIVIRFTEVGAALILHDRADLLFSRSAPLESFISRGVLDAVHNQLADAGNAQEQLPILERFLLERLGSQCAPPASIRRAAEILRDSGGQVSITRLARHVGVSQSALERHLRAYAGASPKMLARLARLQHVFRLRDAGRNLTEIAAEAGFTDQSHMIRDFESFTGVAPSAFFQNQSPRNLPTFYK